MTTKIPAELSSTPGIIDSSNATAITIDSSEEVGIGSTSPSAKLEVLGSSNSTYLKTGGDDSGTNARALTFTSASGTSLAGAVHIINAPSIQGQIAFQTNNGERARITGNGITFSGDTAAANALDDYEEGTWTPTVTTGTISLGTNTSEYTKIGDMVFAQTRITGFSDATSNAQVILGGLPYTVGTDQSHIGTAWGSFGGGINRPTIFFYIGGGAYYGGVSYGPVEHSSLSTGSNLIISLIYRHG